MTLENLLKKGGRVKQEFTCNRGNIHEDESTPRGGHPIFASNENHAGWPVVRDVMNPQYGWVRIPWDVIESMKDEENK